MDNDTKNFFGCLGIVIIALIVAVGFRAHNFKEFIVMAITVIVVFGSLIAAIALLATEGCWNKGWGVLLIFSGLVGAWSVGTFLVTRDYQRALNAQKVWTWGQDTPTPTFAVAQNVTATRAPTDTPAPTLTPTFGPTATPIPGGITAGNLQWISDAEAVAPETVSGTLNEISLLEGAQAASIASQLRLETPLEAGEPRLAGLLLAAYAHQRAGEPGAARDAFNQVVKEAPGTPYAASASFCLKRLDKPDLNPKETDRLYKELWDETPQQGWFQTPEGWQWSNSRLAASRQLITMRADQLSYRLFSLLHERSTFPPPYAYLFIFLVVMVVARLVTLPLQVRSARLAIQMRRLQPQIRMLQYLHSDDPAGLQSSLMELYKQNGVNIWNGCLASVVDLVFVIWMFVAVQSFAPQLYLDGANLWWAKDVTAFSLPIVLVWIGVTVVQVTINYVLQGQSMSLAQSVLGAVIFVGVIGALAYFLKWPAYIFILYGMLTLSGLLVSLILLPIAAATTRR
jgi:hypothetical protein